MFSLIRQTQHPLIVDALPSFAIELTELLVKANESVLAEHVKALRIVDRCRCEDDFCATFYTEPKPSGRYGSDHRCIELEPKEGMVILDVVGSRIARVEVLYRDEVQKVLRAFGP